MEGNASLYSIPFLAWGITSFPPQGLFQINLYSQCPYWFKSSGTSILAFDLNLKWKGVDLCVWGGIQEGGELEKVKFIWHFFVCQIQCQGLPISPKVEYTFRDEKWDCELISCYCDPLQVPSAIWTFQVFWVHSYRKTRSWVAHLGRSS